VKNQNRAIVVCSAERLALAWLPISRISFTSLVQVSDVKAGGGAARNCDALAIAKGWIFELVDSIGIVVGT
jgi:hypothetical protein